MNAPGSHYEAVEIRLGQGVVGVAWRLAQAREKQLVGCGELPSMRGRPRKAMVTRNNRLSTDAMSWQRHLLRMRANDGFGGGWCRTRNISSGEEKEMRKSFGWKRWTMTLELGIP
jgi:hypothetical protein